MLARVTTALRERPVRHLAYLLPGAVLWAGLGFGVLVGEEDAQAEVPATVSAFTMVSPVVAPTVAKQAAPSWDLPNLDHPRVDEFVDMFSGRKRAEFAGFLERSGRYAPMISEKLAERDMPQDLLYLAMIESGFNPRAYSHADASGIWQFIAETGQRYGLEINRAVDERRDPERATEAALDYLGELHDRFGSWYLAAAAYNTGENRVARIMREVTGSERGDDQAYFDIWDRLPRETRDYVPLMIAAGRVAKEPHKYGFADVEPEAPLAFDVVTVAPATPISHVAAAASTTVDVIRELNPQLKLERTRNDVASSLRVPEGRGPSVESALKRLR